VLGKPHGVRGEIGLRLFNAETPTLTELVSITLDRNGKRETHVVDKARPFASGMLIRLAGVTTREQAAALTNSRVRVSRDVLPAPAPGEFFVSDVPGCTVFGEDGARLGVVRQTFWNGAHDVMVVSTDDGAAAGADAGAGAGDDVGDGVGDDPPAVAAGEMMIPLLPDFVRAVDVAARTVRVAWQVEDQSGDPRD
jgi:16S rRNA processing protein RimM